MGDRKAEYEKGYKAAEQDFLDKDNIKLFRKGYKKGYRDGYQAAMEDTKRLILLNAPPEIREQMEAGAQPGWPPRIW